MVIWDLATVGKKVDSASLLIKSAWSLWQSAMLEKKQLTLVFLRRKVKQEVESSSETKTPKESNRVLPFVEHCLKHSYQSKQLMAYGHFYSLAVT